MKLLHQVLYGSGITVIFLSQFLIVKLTEAQTRQMRSFSDWCLDKDKISQQARHTVNVLLQKAGTSECNLANQKLLHLRQLTITVSRISDISPIASLTNLKELRLGGNQISDISSLKSLTNLTKLNLPSNQINDISPLKSLTNLTSLDLASNRISDISPLKSLTNLTSLDLASNRISDISSLKSLTNLNALNLQGNPVSSKACRTVVTPGYGANGSGRTVCHF